MTTHYIQYVVANVGGPIPGSFNTNTEEPISNIKDFHTIQVTSWQWAIGFQGTISNKAISGTASTTGLTITGPMDPLAFGLLAAKCSGANANGAKGNFTLNVWASGAAAATLKYDMKDGYVSAVRCSGAEMHVTFQFSGLDMLYTTAEGNGKTQLNVTNGVVSPK